MVKYIFIAFFLVAAIKPSLAALGPTESIFFSGGSHTEFVNTVQVDASGGTRKFEFAPTLGVGVVLNFPNDQWKFLPEINWVLPQSSSESEVIKNLFMLRADFGYDPLDWLRLRAGTSIMFLNQHGKGGSTQINNGNTTSTFYNPEENRSSLNNTFDLGLEFLLKDWSVRLQTYTYSLFAEESRQVSYTMFISYYWDQ